MFGLLIAGVIVDVIIVMGRGQGSNGGRGAGGEKGEQAKFFPHHLLIVRSAKCITADTMNGDATAVVQIL